MSLPKIVIGISTLLASLMLVSAAAAETVVPPGNGAATQYTEAFPTSGGNAISGDGINGGGGGKSSTPSHVLGHDNAQKLEGEGQVGRETARVAAESAPSQVGGGSNSGSTTAATGSGGADDGTATGGNGGQVDGNGVPTARDNSSGQRQSDPAATGDGSSGLGEVIGQATGSSSGESGLLLPLILLAAVVASFAYAWRRRRPAH